LFAEGVLLMSAILSLVSPGFLHEAALGFYHDFRSVGGGFGFYPWPEVGAPALFPSGRSGAWPPADPVLGPPELRELLFRSQFVLLCPPGLAPCLGSQFLPTFRSRTPHPPPFLFSKLPLFLFSRLFHGHGSWFRYSGLLSLLL